MARIMIYLILLGQCSLLSCELQSQFVVFQTPKTWNEAQSFCREKCFDLATINDMKEMETVLQIVQGKYNDTLWFGLLRGTNPKWHWSLTGDDFYKEGERNYLKWYKDTSFNCGSYKDGTLFVTNCGSLYNSLCFDGTKRGTDQYIVTTQKLEWIAAKEYCRAHYTDLASLRNDAEYQIVQEVTQGLEVWVGLSRDPWEWSDQTDSSLRYWTAGKGVWTPVGKNCGALLMQLSSRWAEEMCDNVYPFICDCRKKRRVIKVKVNLQDSVWDPHDPSVQESILKRMTQKLHDSVGDVFNIHWRKNADGRVFTEEPQTND